MLPHRRPMLFLRLHQERSQMRIPPTKPHRPGRVSPAVVTRSDRAGFSGGRGAVFHPRMNAAAGS